jgi:O-antigen/teichoic acid export membrane protein
MAGSAHGEDRLVMMRRLFENTVVSAFSYAFISVLGLLIVPVIVSTWGLTAFGLVVLARAFLPVGFMGVIDFGVSEISTQSVANARAGKNWDYAAQQISVTLLSACLIGVIVGIALLLGRDAITALFRVDAAHVQGFHAIIYMTAAANLIIFPGLVGEGIVKGFEHFPTMRMLEVASNVIFVLGTLVAAYVGAPFEWAAYAFLAGFVVRAVAVWLVALRLCDRAGLRLGARPVAQTTRDVLAYAWVLSQSKFLGALQFPILPILVGALFGPRAVGVYDVLVRLPRFCKAILSILNTALLPVSARIEQNRADEQLRRLARAGLIILPAITVPPLVGGAVFAEPILRLWIGPDVAQFWPWMALMFLVPVAAQYLSFGSTIMVARPSILVVLNRLLALQLAIMAVTTYATLQHFEERAFILGQAVSWVAVLPWQLWVLARALGIARMRVLRTILIQAGLMAPLAVCCYLASTGVRLENFMELCISFGAWCGLLWTVQYFVVLDDDSRDEVWRMVHALIRIGRTSALSGGT